jgi:hypothetical protein
MDELRAIVVVDGVVDRVVVVFLGCGRRAS